MKKNTKQLIMESSIRLFAENGYKQTSLRDIADEVNIKVGSMYNHFASKNEIMKAIITEIQNKYNTIQSHEINLDKEIDKNIIKKIVENITPFFVANDYIENIYFLLILGNERYYNEDINALIIEKYQLELEKISEIISKICKFRGITITEKELNTVAEIFSTLITYHLYALLTLDSIEQVEFLQNETIESILHILNTLGNGN